VVAPGATDTDAIAFMSKEMRERVAAHTPLRRFGQAEDVAGAVVFLASDEAGFITGQKISVNGGNTLE